MPLFREQFHTFESKCLIVSFSQWEVLHTTDHSSVILRVIRAPVVLFIEGVTLAGCKKIGQQCKIGKECCSKKCINKKCRASGAAFFFFKAFYD
jgi:hypothetical protein